jgi:hypothetical protein
MFRVVDNPQLQPIADEAIRRLRAAFESLSRQPGHDPRWRRPTRNAPNMRQNPPRAPELR